MTFQQQFTLEDFKKLPIESIFQSVSLGHRRITVQLPDGNEVIIQPKMSLKPLPVLKGHIPQGWKEAIYNESK